MTTATLYSANQMMVAARLLGDGIEVTFADGRFGLIPFSEMPDVEASGGIERLELLNAYELHLEGASGPLDVIPWDFARYYCDVTYRQRLEIETQQRTQAIGARIRKMRKAAGLTQQALAGAAGLGRVTLVRIERGDQSAKYKTLNSLALALGVDVFSLFVDEEAYDAIHRPPYGDGPRSSPFQLVNIETRAWEKNQEQHGEAFVGLDAACNELLLGFGRVYDRVEALQKDPSSGQLLEMVEVGANLGARAFKGVRCARQVCELGYYEQALALIRFSLEHIAIALDLPYRLEETARELHQGHQFNMAELAQRVNKNYPYLHFKEYWDTTYKQLSRRVHPSGTALQQLAVPEGGQGYAIPFVSNYDGNAVRETLIRIEEAISLLTHFVLGLSSAVGNEWDASSIRRSLDSAMPHWSHLSRPGRATHGAPV